MVKDDLTRTVKKESRFGLVALVMVAVYLVLIYFTAAPDTRNTLAKDDLEQETSE